LVDDLHFPIVTSTGSRATLIGQDVLQRMLSAMGEQVGTRGNLISYQEGVAMGSLAAGELQATVEGDLRRFIGEAVKMYSANGIGRAKFVMVDLDALRFVLVMSHNIECEGKKTNKPNSEWIRGHLSGSASTALGVPMSCAETKCMAMGDPYCEFELHRLEG
jgi:predicted hydrocarbon binding protein